MFEMLLPKRENIANNFFFKIIAMLEDLTKEVDTWIVVLKFLNYNIELVLCKKLHGQKNFACKSISMTTSLTIIRQSNSQ